MRAKGSVRRRLRAAVWAWLGVSTLLAGCEAGIDPIEATRLLGGLEPGTYAILVTNHGPIVARLFVEQTPRTVANFMGLAEGVRPFTDLKTSRTVTRRFYDGLVFHRVEWQTLVQTGDPAGLGTGGPGYVFPMEIVPELKFDKPGRLAMVTQRNYAHGSQFFITMKPLPELNGRYPIFGEVVRGFDAAFAISNEPVHLNHFPVRTQRLKAVRIWRVEPPDGYRMTESPPPPEVDIGAIPIDRTGRLAGEPEGAPGFLTGGPPPWSTDSGAASGFEIPQR